MRARVEGIYLIFTDLRPHEIAWLQKHLTWEDKRANTVDSLLFTRPMASGEEHYTLWGLIDPIRAAIPPSMTFEVENAIYGEVVRTKVDPEILPGISLYMFQRAAVSKSLMMCRGIIVLPTGAGKTEVIFATYRHMLNHGLVKTAMICVPSRPLKDQFLTRARERGFTEDEVSGTWTPTVKCIISVQKTFHTALKDPENPLAKFVANVDVVLLDEAHHCSANTYIDMLFGAKSAKYVLGYSASPFQQPKNVLRLLKDATTHGILGKPICYVPHAEVESVGLIAKTVVFCYQVSGLMGSRKMDYRLCYEEHIMRNDERNKVIGKFARFFVECELPVLIQVIRKDHAKIFMHMFKDLRTVVVLGNGKSLAWNDHGDAVDTKIDYEKFRRDYKDGVYDIAITTPVMDEGQDMPAVGAVINAGGEKSTIKVIQRTGRGLRSKKKGPNVAYFVDFTDTAHVYLHNHSRIRQEFYHSINATVVTDINVFVGMVRDHQKKVEEAKNVE